jgi:steroid delta-isomerase-like uncharacterized protein
MNESEQTLAVIRDTFAAFNAHDLDRFRRLLADDAALVVGGSPQSFEGPDAVVAAIRPTLDAIPDLHVTVTNAFADGNRGVAEAVREGTNTGPIRLPDGELPPSGRSVRLPECIVFEVADGKIRRMVVYTDMLDTLAQLGLPPAPSEPN